MKIRTSTSIIRVDANDLPTVKQELYNTYDEFTPSEGDVERLVRNLRDHTLGVSRSEIHHHHRYLV